MDQSNPYTSPQTQNPVSDEAAILQESPVEELMPEFIELQRCRDAESVDEITTILKDVGIAHRVGSNSANFDFAMIGSENDAQVIISIRAEDYDAARAAMEKDSLKVELPEDHYLWNSSDEELVEIVAQASEWSAFDVAHARRLIGERGVNSAEIETNKKAYLEMLRAGKPASTVLLVFGWLFAVLGWMYSFIPGLMGMGIGWSLCCMKEKKPEGVFHTYDSKSRKIGANMMFVGCLMGVATLSYRLLTIS